MTDFRTLFNNYVHSHIPPWEIKEESLFDALMDIYSQNSNIVTAKKIHGGHNSVAFYSELVGQSVPKELGDLLLIVHDGEKDTLRICTMQNKYRKKKLPKAFFSCSIDVIQWELLLMRYTINSTGIIQFPSNILNFRNDYLSISSYGIFYKDSPNSFDFLYTVPDYLYPANPIQLPTSKNHSQAFRFAFGSASSSFDPTLSGQSTDEVTFGCNFNLFDASLLAGRIGAPLQRYSKAMNAWILATLQYLQGILLGDSGIGNTLHLVTGSTEILDRTIGTLRTTLEADETYGDELWKGPINTESLPNLLIVETSSEAKLKLERLLEANKPAICYKV